MFHLFINPAQPGNPLDWKGIFFYTFIEFLSGEFQFLLSCRLVMFEKYYGYFSAIFLCHLGNLYKTMQNCFLRNFVQHRCNFSRPLSRLCNDWRKRKKLLVYSLQYFTNLLTATVHFFYIH